MVKYLPFLMLALLFGCANSKDAELLSSLHQQALAQPMLTIEGTNITILVSGTDRAPAVVRVYNPAVAQEAIQKESPSAWANVGMLIGGIGKTLIATAASTNKETTVLYETKTEIITPEKKVETK